MKNVALLNGSLFRMEGNWRGHIIACQAGICWITLEGDPQDYLLEAGKELTIDRAGLVVVQASTDGAICLKPRPGLRNLTRIREKFRGGGGPA